jgi:hypothetical protein
MRQEKTYWLDRSENVRKIFIGLWIFGALWVIPEFFIEKHEDVGFAATFGFYALYGFVACVALVLTAKGLRRILMRPEDYYDR